MGMSAVEIGDEDTVKRRARSRKPRGKRRNTIAGTDQKEIEEVAGNGLVDNFFYSLFHIEFVQKMVFFLILFNFFFNNI